VVSGLPCFGVEDDKGGILEDGFAEKGKKKRRICEMGRLSDPLAVLGSDIMLMILSCLDARSVALCLLVSCGWRVVASSDRVEDWLVVVCYLANPSILVVGLHVIRSQSLCIARKSYVYLCIPNESS